MKYTVRKTLAVLLAAVFTLMLGANAFPALLPRAFADEIVTDRCGDAVVYTWNKTTGKVTISGSGPMLDYNTDNPSPFFLLDNIKTVVIDYGVTSVGEKTFKFCESLESVTFPVDGSFKTIGKEAFLFCSALPDVTLPQGLTTIGESAFEGSGLTSVTIPGTVTQIGKSAFYGIDSLACVTIPKSVTAIPECAFGYCVDLETINYAGSPADWAAMTIHENAFYKTPVSEPTRYYYGVEGAENAINDIGADDGSYEYLARLATAWAVYENLDASEQSKVTNRNVLENAIHASDYVFGACGDCVGYAWEKMMREVVIGGFGLMTQYSKNNSPFTDPYDASDISKVVIANGVTYVGSYSFNGCGGLSELILPDDGSLMGIGDHAFLNCRELENVTLPTGLQSIDISAFQNCDIRSITIPKSVIGIGAWAFAGNENLRTLNYTGSKANWDEKKIQQEAFDGTQVSGPTCYYYGVEGAENAINDVGVNDGSDAYLARVAAAYVAFHKLSDGDKAKVTNAGVLQAAIDAALGYEFGQCGNCVGYAWNQTTGKVVIGGCGPMTEYSSPRSPFYGSNEVKTVVIANGVTTVGKSAFSNCRKLESVTFPDDGSLAAIGEYAFEQCQSLQSVALPRGLTTVGTAAFGECSALQSVTFPQGLTAIGAYAFEKCTSLQSVSLPQGLTTIGQRTFHMCTSLENITLPQGLTTIHSLAFYDTGLKSVTIPKSVTKIGDFAFAENSDLQTLNYTGSPADWATVTVAGNAFDNTPVNAPTCYYYGVEGAMNAINDIGTVTYDDACKGRIDEARKAYDRLSKHEMTLVTNQETLFKAEDSWKALETEALIAAIGTVEYTAACKEKIDAARAAWEALTADQQALVTNYATLTGAETAYHALDFAAYVTELQGNVQLLAADGDSEAVGKIIADAVAALAALTYDEAKTLDENKALAAETADIADALAAQRAADAAAAQLAADKAEFEAYKETVKGLADAQAQTGDSEACRALIAAAKRAVDALEYGESKDLDANKAAVDTAADLTKLASDLADQRAAEQSVEPPEEPAQPEKPVAVHSPCPICGELHDGSIVDNFIGLFHRILFIVYRLTLRQVSYVVPEV